MTTRARVLSVRMAEPMWEQLDAKAVEKGVSKSMIVQEALRLYLSDYASGPLEPVFFAGRQVGWQRRALPVGDV